MYTCSFTCLRETPECGEICPGSDSLDLYRKSVDDDGDAEPEDHDDSDEEEDVKADDEKHRDSQEPVTGTVVHPTLLVLPRLHTRI